MRATTFTLVSLLAVCGCTHKPVAVSPNPAPPVTDPRQAQYDAAHGSAFQIGSAVNLVMSAYERLDDVRAKFPKDSMEALSDALDAVDSAGAGLQDVEADSDFTFGDFVAKDLATWPKTKSARIKACQDALHDLRDAASSLEDLRDGLPSELSQVVDNSTADIEDATGAVTDALRSLGTQPEPDTDQPVETDGEEGPPPPTSKSKK